MSRPCCIQAATATGIETGKAERQHCRPEGGKLDRMADADGAETSPRHPTGTRRKPPRPAINPPGLSQPRSRVTTQRQLFADGGDIRSAWARRLRDLFELHISDLGGNDAASEAERSIARRAAVITVELERMEASFAVRDATPDQIELYHRTASSLRRLLESLGLKRRPRDVTEPTTYIAIEYENTENKRS